MSETSRQSTTNGPRPSVRRVWRVAAVLLAGALVTGGLVWLLASPAPGTEGMVWIPGGKFWMGDEEFPDAHPVHQVRVDGFWVDRTEVTNAEFARFVDATGYVTVAEQKPDPKD